MGYYADHNQSYYLGIESEVKTTFPDVKVVPFPSYQLPNTSWSISSSVGSYANSLVSYNAVYVPFFARTRRTTKGHWRSLKHTDKRVVPIRAACDLGVLGGSIHWLSWQIDVEHPIAHKLFEFVDQTTTSMSPTNSVPVICGKVHQWYSFLFIIPTQMVASS